MENEFVTYKQALALKELDFDEICFGYYDHQIKELDTISSEVCEKLCKHDTHIKAPTYSQAFRWFREKHKLQHEIVYDMSNDLINKIYVYTIFGTDRSEEYKTYEEAESACLNKLIEIVKKQII